MEEQECSRYDLDVDLGTCLQMALEGGLASTRGSGGQNVQWAVICVASQTLCSAQSSGMTRAKVGYAMRLRLGMSQ